MEAEGLTQLLQHPAIWRGAHAAPAEAIGTGFAELDACLPGKGWPRAGLIEILIPQLGSGELYLLMPVLAALSHRDPARWCAWVAPPYQPFAPALAAQGVALERLLLVRACEPLWALEQALGLGACAMVLAWVRKVGPREIRRLQLAAERGRTLGVLFRGHRAAHEASSAVLRVLLEPAGRGVRLTLLKSRGGCRGPVQISWRKTHAFECV
jgi:cell division inhibitor SulA/protein ImuA